VSLPFSGVTSKGIDHIRSEGSSSVEDAVYWIKSGQSLGEARVEGNKTACISSECLDAQKSEIRKTIIAENFAAQRQTHNAVSISCRSPPFYHLSITNMRAQLELFTYYISR
jgi:hypothetical protein